MERELIPVLPSEDLPVGVPAEPGLRRATVGATEVFLVRLASGEVVAFGTQCPHQGTELDDATFWETTLRCPRHLYLYDPRTGENVLPARDARPENLWKLKPGYLRVHRVEERDGWILVDEAAKPPPPGYDDALERRPTGVRWPTRGQPAEPVAPPRPETPRQQSPETVRVAPGAIFELRLRTPFRPAHAWSIEVEGSPLSVVEQTFVQGESCHVVRLRAPGPGQATVRCRYARPWDAEGTEAEVRRFVIVAGPP